MGILAANAISVPVYPTSAGSQVAYVLGHSGARVCFVDTEDQYAKIVEHREELPDLQHVVMFDETTPSLDEYLMSFRSLRSFGRSELVRDRAVVRRRRAEVSAEALATLVYTSGTTGPPKGAMLTHANLMATMRSIMQLIALDHTDRFLSFLPLSHITERCVSHFGLIVSGGETWFARGFTTVATDLPDCRPTLFFAVPRVGEVPRRADRARREPGGLARRPCSPLPPTHARPRRRTRRWRPDELLRQGGVAGARPRGR